METPMADEKTIAAFRKKLIEDANYRAQFADDPAEALRAVGIDVPESAVIPAIDRQELETRVARIKAVLGNKVSELYTAKDFGRLVRDRGALTKIEHAGNIATRVGSPGAGGTVYTISAFGTIDW
jgi:hypothetical protein